MEQIENGQGEVRIAPTLGNELRYHGSGALASTNVIAHLDLLSVPTKLATILHEAEAR